MRFSKLHFSEMDVFLGIFFIANYMKIDLKKSFIEVVWYEDVMQLNLLTRLATASGILILGQQ